MEHVFDIALTLHADHELNASTFAARVMAATLSDIHSAVTAGIGALKGPLHGGANEEVIRMLLDAGDERTALAARARHAGQQEEDPGLRSSRLSHRRSPGYAFASAFRGVGHAAPATWIFIKHRRKSKRRSRNRSS